VSLLLHGCRKELTLTPSSKGGADAVAAAAAALAATYQVRLLPEAVAC
jgi:hypothetical protein